MPLTLKKTIQAAREEVRVRVSNEESRKLYRVATKPAKPKLMCFNCEKIGHNAKDCRVNKFKAAEKTATATSYVKTITCNYCKKPGHIL